MRSISLPVEGFFFREGFRVGYGGFGQFGISGAFVGVAAEEGHGVIVNFLAHFLIDVHGVAADNDDWRGGTGMRSGAMAAISAARRM